MDMARKSMSGNRMRCLKKPDATFSVPKGGIWASKRAPFGRQNTAFGKTKGIILNINELQTAPKEGYKPVPINMFFASRHTFYE